MQQDGSLGNSGFIHHGQHRKNMDVHPLNHLQSPFSPPWCVRSGRVRLFSHFPGELWSGHTLDCENVQLLVAGADSGTQEQQIPKLRPQNIHLQIRDGGGALKGTR